MVLLFSLWEKKQVFLSISITTMRRLHLPYCPNIHSMNKCALSMSSLSSLGQALEYRDDPTKQSFGSHGFCNLISWRNHAMKKQAHMCRNRLLQIVLNRKKWALL